VTFFYPQQQTEAKDIAHTTQLPNNNNKKIPMHKLVVKQTSQKYTHKIPK
jgi:hypothetical protein